MVQKSFILIVAALALSAPVCAQEQGQAPGRGQAQRKGQPQARPDPHKIDMFLCDWHEALPRHTHGGLVERDVLTQGSQTPTQRCAVLTAVHRLSYATLMARGGIPPMKLQGEQEVFYIVSGKGTVTSGGQTSDLYDGVAYFAPAGVEFSMKNTGDDDLNMYIINEQIPATFTPGPKLLVKDVNFAPIASSTGHWVHIVKNIFGTADGLASFRCITVSVDPMTIPEPHAHGWGSEEVWLAVKGKSLLNIGTQLRWQTPGMGYLAPPGDPMTRESITAGLSFPHTNMNPGTEQVKFLYFQAQRSRPAAEPAATPAVRQ
jgi:mannose-6-phosphate isomerase-like protein (cupin superfamily)